MKGQQLRQVLVRCHVQRLHHRQGVQALLRLHRVRRRVKVARRRYRPIALPNVQLLQTRLRVLACIFLSRLLLI